MLNTLEYPMVGSHKDVLEPTTPLGNHAKDDRYSAPHFNRVTSANHEFTHLFWKSSPHTYVKKKRSGQGEQRSSKFQVSRGLRPQDLGPYKTCSSPTTFSAFQ